MEIFIPLLISSIAGLSTVLGSFIIFFKIKRIEEFITFCLSFSLSVMITLSVIDLIPNSSYIIFKNYGFIKGFIICFIFFIIGVLLVTVVNKKIDNKIKKSDSKNLFKLGILSMFALMLHNFPEGIATFMSAYKDVSLGISLGTAIMMHNIPEGISIAVPLFYSTGSKKRGVVYTFISGLAEPLGALLAYIFLKNYITDVMISLVLILVAGIMITLAINEMYPEAERYKKSKYMYIGLIIGTFLMILNSLL